MTAAEAEIYQDVFQESSLDESLLLALHSRVCGDLAATMQQKCSVCLVFLRKDFVVRRCQIHKGYAARLTPRLTQKSTAQPLAFLPHGYGLVADWAGRWRTVEVAVGNLHPPPPYRVPGLMRDYALDLQARWPEAARTVAGRRDWA